MALKNCLGCSDGKLESELVKLKCVHSYCWLCLNKYIRSNISCKIKCPFQLCSTLIRDSVIRQVLSGDDIAKYENAVLCKTNIFFCLLKECNNPVSYTDANIQYECMKCSLINCISCKAPHNLIKCADFKSKNKSQQTAISETEFKNAGRILETRVANKNRESLLEYEEINLLKNDEIFTCLCDTQFGKGKGIKLQNCFHNVCSDCLKNYINRSDRVPVSCPFCSLVMNDREIKSVLTPIDFEMYHRRCKNAAIKQIGCVFQCKQPNCDNYWKITSNTIKEFKCTKCQKVNCIECEAIHTGETCTSYKIRNSSKLSTETKKKDNIMTCPQCKTFLSKNEGCNWIQCQSCQIELCWIRKMLRWGPNGRGDTSGGCRCMVNDKPCHVNCKSPYCTPDNRILFQQNMA